MMPPNAQQMVIFQSTLPQEERQIGQEQYMAFQRISIHAPTRGATIDISKLPSAPYFNPRSHKRSNGMYCSWISRLSYFNPRSHKRSDDAYDNALANLVDFNPRSTRGATSSASPAAGVVLLFQSTLPQEERLSVDGILPVDAHISIHAPTRGATAYSYGLGTVE